MDFSALLSSAVENINLILTAFLSLLVVASGIWISFLAWRLFRYCTNNVVTDLDGNVVDGAHWGDDGIEYDGLIFEDEGDLSDYMKDEAELFEDYFDGRSIDFSNGSSVDENDYVEPWYDG